VWVFVYPILSGERHVERRQASVVRSQPVARAQAAARAGVKSRREQLETTLKEFEDRRKKSKNPPLSLRIAQAGLNLSPRQFMLISAVLGIIALGAGLGADVGLFPAIGMSFAAALGLPR
jgi:tight adherence protein B